MKAFENVMFTKDKENGKGLLKLNATEKFFDDDLLPLDSNAFGDREESKSISTTIVKSSWIRVMPGLKRNDTIRVRDYGDICVPSRIRIVNDNTFKWTKSFNEK